MFFDSNGVKQRGMSFAALSGFQPMMEWMRRHRASLRITIAYLIFGLLWIVVSDRILAMLVGDPALRAEIQTIKGWAFVAITALLLFIYSHRILAREMASQNALLESEKRFRAVFNNSFQFTVITDLDGRIRMINQAALDFAGLQEDQLLGQNLTETRVFAMDEETRRKIRDAFAEAAAGRFARCTISYKDSEDRPRKVDFSIKPIFDRGGGAIHFLVLEARDITDVLRAEIRALEVLAFASILMIKSDCRTGKYEYVSPAVQAVTGFTEEEFKAAGRERVTARIHPDDIDAYRRQTESLMEPSPDAKNRSATIEVRFRHKSGEYHFQHIERTVTFDVSGEPQSIFGLYRDITREKEAEEKLAETRALLAAAVEQTPAGIIIADAPDGSIRLANSAALDMRGWSVQPRSASEVQPYQGLQPLHPDGTPYGPDELPLAQAMRKGRTIKNQDLIIRRGDGARRWVLANAAPVRDERANLIAGIVVLTDITERKASEDRLQHYEHLVSTSQDLMALIDSSFKCQAVSKAFAEYFGKTRESVIGATVSDVVGSQFFDRTAFPRIERCLRGDEIHERIWITFPDGRRRFVDLALYPHFEKGRNGRKISGAVLSARDITENKILEDQVRQAYKMEAMGTLAGGIAHDFNNILTAVMGFAEIALALDSDREQMRAFLEQIHQAGRRASELVKQILTFSRQTDLEIKPLQPYLIIKEALRLIRASLPTTIEIDRRIDSQAYVLADPTQLHQIIMNLCANSAYAMKDQPGRLTIELRDEVLDAAKAAIHPDLSPGNYVRLTVADTGSGMSAEILERIFDPFFTTKPKGEGTGMGLPLVHGIVKAYKGATLVESEPGAGTRFDIYLPAVTETAMESTATEYQPLPTGDERILFVDDEAALVELAQVMLRKLGYHVKPVSSSLEAFKLFAADPGRFDLVITDLTMPGMTGDQLAARMLEIRPDLPILVATGFSEKLTPEKVRQLGIRKVLLKPLLMHDMAVAIREAVGKPA